MERAYECHEMVVQSRAPSCIPGETVFRYFGSLEGTALIYSTHGYYEAYHVPGTVLEEGECLLWNLVGA